MGKATFIKQLSGWNGDARLYKVDPPMQFEEYGETDHIAVSGVDTNETLKGTVPGLFETEFGEETYIFPTDENGIVFSWIELEGSFKGSIDHEKALNNAGYELEETNGS